jgi:hypothetical protein
MNMKLAITKKTSSRIFNRAPINFWEPEKVEEDSTIKNNFYQDSICHEVRYNPTDKKSDTYKRYIKPFSYGTPEQWLKFMEDLNVVIRGNGLDKNSSTRFNLTCSSLKGEALCVFNDKAAEQEEETRDTHIQCLRAITEQVFPKDNPLSKQKTYMRNHVFLHLSDRTISEFCARWINSTIISTSSLHLNPINVSRRMRPKKSSIISFQNIGSLTCRETSLT